MKLNNILKPNWPQPSNVCAFTTLKNCKLEDLDLPNNQLWLNQEHGATVLQARFSDCIDLQVINSPVADGAYTQEKNVTCLIKTADCLPILITNNQGTLVAALHAGWRGLAKGIINNFFEKTKSLNFKKADLIFWLGPAIGPLAFEVGEEVVEQFTLYQSAFTKINNNKYLANIYQIAKNNLYTLGIKDNQIFSQYYCTHSQDDLFYSYRRDTTNPNRMHSLIWIKN